MAAGTHNCCIAARAVYRFWSGCQPNVPVQAKCDDKRPAPLILRDFTNLCELHMTAHFPAAMAFVDFFPRHVRSHAL